jgi:hypothetical protein
MRSTTFPRLPAGENIRFAAQDFVAIRVTLDATVWYTFFHCATG